MIKKKKCEQLKGKNFARDKALKKTLLVKKK